MSALNAVNLKFRCKSATIKSQSGDEIASPHFRPEPSTTFFWLIRDHSLPGGDREKMTRHTSRTIEKLALQSRPLRVSTDLRQLQRNARAASALLTAMANESRLLLLCRISTGALSVGELVAGTDLSQSAVSQHLAILRRDGIVTTRRAGKSVYYSVCSAAAVAVLETLYAKFCGSQTREVSKGSQRTYD